MSRRTNRPLEPDADQSPTRHAGSAALHPLGWHHAADEIPEGGASFERSATAQQRTALAGTLGLNELAELTARYRLLQRAGGRTVLEGTLHARLVQTCVVSLEPFETTLEEPLEAEFWQQDRLPAPAATEREIGLGEVDQPQALIEGRADVGQVVFDTLALAIDPHPRKHGAALDWQPADPPDAAQQAARSSPFGALEKLKKTR